MSLETNESDNRMGPKEQISSPSLDEANSGRLPTLGERVLKKGPWTSAEDAILVDYVKKHGEGNWNAVQKNTGLLRCGKSCRLRWANHLRPNLKKGAFTDEEEQKIVELHAQMGNKWARMAAHLPGRTDNEIKNYWNTRIKRRQRAGLPLYPADLCTQASDGSQEGFSEFGNDGKTHNDFLQGKYDFPVPMFDLLKINQGTTLLYGPCSDITSNNLFCQGVEQQGLGLMNPTIYHMKRFRDSEAPFPNLQSSIYCRFPKLGRFSEDPPDKIHQGYGGGCYPSDSNPGVKCLVTLGSHALSNGNFSASCPLPGVVETELPSLQFAETDIISLPSSSLLEVVDACIPSSEAQSLQSDCGASPRNNGLLESLLYEAQSLGLEKNQPMGRCSSSCVFTPSNMIQSSTPTTELEEHSGRVSPLGSSTASAIHEWTSLEEFSPSNLVSDGGVAGSGGMTAVFGHVSEPSTKESGDVVSPQTDFSGPDALLEFDWAQESSHAGRDQSTLNDVIAAFLGGGQGFGDEPKEVPATAVAGSATFAHGIRLEAYPWSNMPHACQMP